VTKQAEGRLSTEIVAALNRIPGVLVRKRHISPFAVAGDPDIYGSAKGRHVELETKLLGKKPTALQGRRLQEWQEAGAVVGVVHSVGEALALVEAA
jgi:hypothetical protein